MQRSKQDIFFRSSSKICGIENVANDLVTIGAIKLIIEQLAASYDSCALEHHVVVGSEFIIIKHPHIFSLEILPGTDLTVILQNLISKCIVE